MVAQHDPATPQRRRLLKDDSEAQSPRRRPRNADEDKQQTKRPSLGGTSPAQVALLVSSPTSSQAVVLGGMRECDPVEIGLDAKSLEDHRRRNRWQSSLGILPGLAECVISGNSVAYLDLMGSADVERGTPMRPTTLFRCFSMTKPITAVALMVLVEKKLVALDDPVAKYLPAFQDMKVVRPESAEDWSVNASSGEQHLEPAQRQITLRHLVTHTSGLGYGPDRVGPKEPLKASSAVEASYLGLVEAVDKGNIRDLAEFCDALAALPLRFQPGTQWLYSHGVDVVGRVIEVVSGQPLDLFLKEEVFEPLGMIRTTFSVTQRRANDLAAMYLAEQIKDEKEGARGKDAPNSEEAAAKAATLRRVDGRRPEDSRWCGKRRVLAGGGIMGSCSGGLVSCLRDTAHFVGMLMRGGKTPDGRQFLRRTTMRVFWRDQLALRCVVGHGLGRRRPLPGWPYGPKIGWTVLGHIRRRDRCLYMGGWSTSWAIYPRTFDRPAMATISMSQSLVYFDVPGWVARRDELDAAVEFGSAQHRRRLAMLAKVHSGRRKSSGGSAATCGGKQTVAVRRVLARALRRAAAAKGKNVRVIARQRSSPARRSCAMSWKRSAAELCKSPKRLCDKRRRRSIGAA